MKKQLIANTLIITFVFTKDENYYPKGLLTKCKYIEEDIYYYIIYYNILLMI